MLPIEVSPLDYGTIDRDEFSYNGRKYVVSKEVYYDKNDIIFIVNRYKKMIAIRQCTEISDNLFKFQYAVLDDPIDINPWDLNYQ